MGHLDTISNKIEINSKILGGKPIIRGTRIPVSLILQMLREGSNFSDIIKGYPRLTKEDIQAVLDYSIYLIEMNPVKILIWPHSFVIKLELIVDECLHTSTLTLLENLGFIVISIDSILSWGARDEEIVNYASTNNLALITHDRRFGFLFHKSTEKPTTTLITEVLNPHPAETKWNKIKENDMFISTPNCISPTIKEIFNFPKDTFDLILFDEGHHLPASTWESISNYFISMCILFTATPFRRDKKHLSGKIIYEFSIREAYEDKIYGDIEFIPISAKSSESTEKDILIAKKTEEIYNSDKEKGYNHLILVRSSKIQNSKELLKIYEENTNLRLELVNSQLLFQKLIKRSKN